MGGCSIGSRDGGSRDGIPVQVLSAVEVDSGHPNAGATGHNIASPDIAAAWREPCRCLVMQVSYGAHVDFI